MMPDRRSLRLCQCSLLEIGFGDGAVSEKIFCAAVQLVREGRGIARP